MKNVEHFDDFLREVVNINQSRLDRLNGHVKAATEYLSQKLDSYRKVERQGSYALRTIIKPVEGREYDADILLFMEYERSKKPSDYINEVYQCLNLNGNYAGKVHRRTRCVFIDYAGEFHLDIVPCVEVNGRHFICNNKTNEFEETDGTGYRDWFNAKPQVTNGNLKRVTRLLKYMRDHKGNFTAPSILLTTLIGTSVYDGEDDAKFKNVPDTLHTVVNRINDFLQKNPSMPEIRNPVLPNETFTRHWDQNKYRNFREKFSVYTKRINEAYAETDRQKSVQKWQNLFGDGFGRSGSSQTVNRGTTPGGSQQGGRTTTGSAATGITLPPRSVTPRKPYAR